MDDNSLYEAQRLVYKNINFIDESQIPKVHRLRAYDLVKDIDLKDIVFVAPNRYQESILWTGDKVLIKGLKLKGYDKLITTQEMVKLRNRLGIG